MINHNALADRLNALKDGTPVPEQINPEYSWAPQKPEPKPKLSLTKEIAIDMYRSLSRISGVLVASALYGFGIEALFSMDWEPIQALGVGFLFNHSLTTIPLALKNLFTKKGV